MRVGSRESLLVVCGCRLLQDGERFPLEMGVANRFARFARGVKCCETLLADQDQQ